MVIVLVFALVGPPAGALTVFAETLVEWFAQPQPAWRAPPFSTLKDIRMSASVLVLSYPFGIAPALFGGLAATGVARIARSLGRYVGLNVLIGTATSALLGSMISGHGSASGALLFGAAGALGSFVCGLLTRGLAQRLRDVAPAGEPDRSQPVA